MSCKYVVGNGPMLDRALAAWRECEPAMDLRPVTVDLNAGREALAAVLDTLGQPDATAFVALDEQHLNFNRLALLEALEERGLPMPPLVGPGVLASTGVVLGENCWIGPGAMLQHGCAIGRNAVVGAGVIVGAGACVGQSSWLDDGVVIGRDAKVGAHVTLGLGVLVGRGVRVADHCVIDRPGRIEKDVPGRTFLHASHDGPIFIVGQ